MTLKVNSKRTLDVAIAQPTLNQTQAYKEVHPNASDISARTNAYKLFKKPEAQVYLQRYIDKAKTTVVSLLDDKKSDIKLRSAEAILDRALGKATQRTEVQTTGILINLDLTGSNPEPTEQ